MNRNILNKKIEDTINSLEGIKQADANPFLYTKIQERLNNKNIKKIFPVKQNIFVLRFAVILIAALLLNVFTYFTYPEPENNTPNTNSREENLKSFAKEYSITGSTYNY